MPRTGKNPLICYLCGEPIERHAANPDLQLLRDHVPPKQFYAQDVRKAVHLNLVTQPTHRKCSSAYKDDEEYFYHSMYVVVQQSNHQMSQVMFRDLDRRAVKPQTRAIVRGLLRSAHQISTGGVYLPPGMAQFRLSANRIDRVALKVAQGVLFGETLRYLPLENAKDIRLCLEERDVPKLYQLSWQASPISGNYPKVFSYRYFYLQPHNLHLLTTLYWGSFMFCLAFTDSNSRPSQMQAAEAERAIRPDAVKEGGQ